jgi:transposase-like protein
MPVMAVNENHEHGQGGDYRSRPRWSAGTKMEAVLRLLPGEPLEVLSRELGVEAHRLAAWRDEFLEGGEEALKGQRPDRPGDDRALRQAERKVGQLTMANEILRAAAETRGLSIPPGSGPDSHGAPPVSELGVSRARRAPLDHLRPPAGRRAARPSWADATDRRRGVGATDRASRQGLAVRWGGLPQGPGPAAS